MSQRLMVVGNVLQGFMDGIESSCQITSRDCFKAKFGWDSLGKTIG